MYIVKFSFFAMPWYSKRLDIVNERGLTGSFTISRLGCTIFIFPISNNSNDFSNKTGFEDLNIEIFDQDKFKNDANLGNVRIDVRNLIKNGGQMKEICSELQNIKTGNILFSLKVGNIELDNEIDTFKHHVF